MPAALALIADRPARQRGQATPWIVLGSIGAHLLILAGLVAGVQIMPPLVEPPVLSVELMRADRTAAPKQETNPPPKAATAQPAASTPEPAASSRVAPSPSATPAPSPPTSATAPPGFKARGLTGGSETLREAARAGIGCRNADGLALTRAERAVCDETLGEKNKNRPAMYAVIDPAKKAAFDGDCKKDDEWCLYRAGKGPYPGLLALGRKKKIKGWD